MRLSTKSSLISFLSIFLLTACGSFEFNVESHLVSPTPTVSQVLTLATPSSQEPAAGICGGFEGEMVTVTIYPDIPDPRCVVIRSDQMLKVVNRREESLQVSIANLETTLLPGDEFTFQIPFGQYLASGVHYLEVLPCCGAALWLK